jgi:hypothetical protein
MVANGKKLQYYQVGHYETEYLPETTNTINEEWTTGLSALGWAERFSPIGNKRFADLNTGTIYRADRNIQLAIILPFTQTSLGTLTITQGTLFSVNNQHQPVLLKGQLTANFGSPATVYAIKFDKYNLGEFQIKLNEFIHGLLAVDEYFVINNIHTQFGITNKSNKVEVFVSDGTVSVLVNNQKKLIESGRKITINAANQIHESRYLSVQQKAILIGILIAATGIILFVFRKTAIVKKIHAISLFIGKNILKLCRQLCLGIYQTAKIVFPWAGRKLKTLLLLIIKNIKSKKGGK